MHKRLIQQGELQQLVKQLIVLAAVLEADMAAAKVDMGGKAVLEVAKAGMAADMAAASAAPQEQAPRVA